MNNTERDFNLAAKIFLGISMFATLMAIISCFQQISLNSYIGGSNSSQTIEIVVDLLILVAAGLTFCKKRYGLIALVLLFIIRIFVTIPFGSNISYSYLLGGKTAYFLRDFAPFAIAMCFKKNGISGWKSMLASYNYVQTHTKRNIQETTTNAEGKVVVSSNDDSNIEQKINDLSTTEKNTSLNPQIESQAQECAIQPNSQSEECKVIEKNITNKHHNKESGRRIKINLSKLSGKTKLIIATFSAIAIIAAILCTIIGVKDYPEYIKAFGDKWKYTFKLPNNKLADNLYKEALGLRHNGGFFFEQDGDRFWRNEWSFYHNIEENLNKYHNANIYKMLDTVKVKDDIETSKSYAARWHNSYQWGLFDGDEVDECYDEWHKTDPDVIIIRLEDYDMRGEYNREHELISYAAETPATDPKVVQEIADYYVSEGNFNKAADIYALSLKHKKNNPTIIGLYALSSYHSTEPEKAKELATKALEIDTKEPSSLQVMCQIEADDLNWGEAKKWSKKAIDYGTEHAEPYFVYAEALFKQGEKSIAKEYYNKAYNIDSQSPLAERYKECGGCPFDIISLSFAFSKADGTIITDYGDKLYSSKSQYISTKAKVDVLRAEDCKIQCKLYSKGVLSKGEDSGDNYTYESDLYFYTTGSTERRIGGWGSSYSGNWSPGNYRFEIWYDGEKIGEESFHIY